MGVVLLISNSLLKINDIKSIVIPACLEGIEYSIHGFKRSVRNQCRYTLDLGMERKLLLLMYFRKE